MLMMHSYFNLCAKLRLRQKGPKQGEILKNLRNTAQIPHPKVRFASANLKKR
jgi:hypothetical protein